MAKGSMEDDGVPLLKKIEKLMQVLISTLTDARFVVPKPQAAVPSDSDYEDDLIAEVTGEFFRQEQIPIE